MITSSSYSYNVLSYKLVVSCTCTKTKSYTLTTAKTMRQKFPGCFSSCIVFAGMFCLKVIHFGIKYEEKVLQRRRYIGGRGGAVCQADII